MSAGMTPQDSQPVLDPDDAREARERLGVLAAALLEEAHGLCVDPDALSDAGAAEHLTCLLSDAATLAAAMAVLARLWREGCAVSPARPRSGS